MRTRSLSDDSYPSDDELRRNLATGDKDDDGDGADGAVTGEINVLLVAASSSSFVGYSQISLGLYCCASAKMSLMDQHVVVVGMLKCCIKMFG
jgi:hypothetical protein